MHSLKDTRDIREFLQFFLANTCQKDPTLTHASTIFCTYEISSRYGAATREERERKPTESVSLIAATRARVTLYMRELRKLLRDLHSTLYA